MTGCHSPAVRHRAGYDHKTALTWVKPPPFGPGSYFRNQIEHVLFPRRAAISVPDQIASVRCLRPRGQAQRKAGSFLRHRPQGLISDKRVLWGVLPARSAAGLQEPLRNDARDRDRADVGGTAGAVAIDQGLRNANDSRATATVGTAALERN